jgi:hypothetical protein
MTAGFNRVMAGLETLHRLVLREAARAWQEQRERDPDAQEEDATEEPSGALNGNEA